MDDQTNPHGTHGSELQEPSPFRKYGWVLIILALLLVGLCIGAGVVTAQTADLSLLDRFRDNSGQPAPTFIPPDTDAPPATATGEAIPTAAETAVPTDAPTATVTVTATRPASASVTCQCNGPDYACSDGSIIYDSPRCAPAVTPTCNCEGNDWVCSDGSRSVNDLRCGTVCVCQGNDLVCNDGTVGYFNPQCACHCEGTTMVCNDGGSEPNSSFCKKNK